MVKSSLKDFIATIVEADRKARDSVEKAKEKAYSDSSAFKEEKDKLRAKCALDEKAASDAEAKVQNKRIADAREESEKRIAGAKQNAEKYLAENRESAARAIFEKMLSE